MITFITGKPGDGKTLYSVSLALKVLKQTEKFVVTNIPLNRGAVRQYLAENGAEGIDLDSRAKVISDDQVTEFFRHRSDGLVLPVSPDHPNFEGGGFGKSGRMERNEFNAWMKEAFLKIAEAPPEARKPVVYFIDEAHEYFSAREWATNGRASLYYASKHRHLHDEIYFVTQVMENVEKQLRGLASETLVVRNHLRRSIGPFKLRPMFRVRSYYGIPTPQAQPFATTDFPLDPAGVAACYNTTGALGVHSKPEEITNRGRLPWWSLFVALGLGVLAIIAVFVAAPLMGGKAVGSVVSGAGGAGLAQKVLPGLPSLPSSAPAAPRVAVREDVPTRAPDVSPAKEPGDVPPVEVRGVLHSKNRVSVVLSDGRTLTERDPELQDIHRNGVVVDGKKLYFAKPEPKAPAPKEKVVIVDVVPPPPATEPVAEVSDIGTLAPASLPPAVTVNRPRNVNSGKAQTVPSSANRQSGQAPKLPIFR